MAGEVMIIGTAVVTVYFPEGHSLKDKRSILQSLLKRIRNKFNSAVAELADQDKWQKGQIGIAVIGGNKAHADSQLQSIIGFIESDYRVVVGEIELEIL